MTWFDRLGGTASGLCAVHCAATGALPMFAAAVGAELNETLEWGFFGIAIVLALFAAVSAYRVHASPAVLAGFGVGVATLGLGRAAEALSLFEGGGVLSIVGGLILVAAHVYSLRCHRDCACELPVAA